jgi:TOBE domain
VVANLGNRRVRAVGNGPVAPGAPLILAVRPEKFWFARRSAVQPEANVNRLAAIVRDVTLVGEMHRYTLETEFGTLLSLKQQHRFGLLTPELSEPVIVEWSAQDTLIV